MNKALLVIDLQNDYFPGGKFPLWNTEATLANVEQAIRSARAKGVPVIHIQHIANPREGTRPVLQPGDRRRQDPSAHSCRRPRCPGCGQGVCRQLS